MIDETDASSGDSKRGCLIAALIVIIGIFIWNYTHDDKKVVENNNSNHSYESVKKQWYEGGTLHKAKISEWRNATAENKLATCADFVTHIHKEISYPKTYALVVCIETAIKDNPSADQLDVSQVAAGCEILIENQK